MEKKQLPDPLYVSTSITAQLLFGDNNSNNRHKVKRLVEAGYLMIDEPVKMIRARKESKSKNKIIWIIKKSVDDYMEASKNRTLDAHKKELAKKINN